MSAAQGMGGARDPLPRDADPPFGDRLHPDHDAVIIDSIVGAVRYSTVPQWLRESPEGVR
jgi:hypothetical protein